MLGALNEKQKQFANEYLIDFKATPAYIRAGYKATGNSAAVNAGKLLNDPRIQEYIQLRMKDREKRTEITQDRVLQELAKIGFADIKGYLAYRTERAQVGTENGTPIFGYQDVIELNPSDQVDGAAISEVKYTKEGISFKLHDKVSALEKIARHLGMFVDKTEISGSLVVIKGESDLED